MLLRFSRPPLPALADTELTYPEVGATQSDMPTDYRHVDIHVRLGRGEEIFQRAATALCSFEVHRRAGLTVQSSQPNAEPGVLAALAFGRAYVYVIVPCRVVYVVNEPDRRGFAYGTLRGHPESGEEAFIINLSAD